MKIEFLCWNGHFFHKLGLFLTFKERISEKMDNFESKMSEIYYFRSLDFRSFRYKNLIKTDEKSKFLVQIVNFRYKRWFLVKIANFEPKWFFFCRKLLFWSLSNTFVRFRGSKRDVPLSWCSIFLFEFLFFVTLNEYYQMPLDW